ncbi:MAG: FAD-dependent oxidoreductase, partial [Myxococcota bacterium]
GLDLVEEQALDQFNAKEGLVHLVSMQDLDDCERLTPSTREAVVIGGGLIGIELVECLLFHKVKTTFLVREPWYWPMALGKEEATFVAEHMREHGVDLRLSEEMVEAHVDDKGRVNGVTTNKGNRLPCQMLGIAAGVHPAIERIKAFSTAPELGRGIIVDETLETSIPGVFACGDCAEIHPKEGKPYGELIWYSAKRQGKLVGAYNLFGDKVTYQPPLFFNSSKFFEVEYTTVGNIMKAPKGSQTIYLKMPRRPISVRIVHDGEKVLGFNMLGSRWNHEVLERWIRERRSPEFAFNHLKGAQYDVEFNRANLSAMTRQDLPLETVR